MRGPRAALLPRLRGRGAAEPARRRIAGQAVQRELAAGVAELAFRAQHEHRQALQRGRQHVGTAGEQQFVGLRLPCDEAREQPALGAAIAGQPRLRGIELNEIRSELAVQEARGIGAVRADRAEVRQPRGTFQARRNGIGHAPIIMSGHDWRGRRVGRGATLLKFLQRLLVLTLVLVVAAGAAALWWLTRPLPLAAERVELSIEPGTPPRDVALAWVAAGVKTDPLLLYAWFRFSGQARRIRAGSYEIGTGTTPSDLLDKMVRGEETLETLRLIEGWNFRQVRAELAKSPSLRPLSAQMSDEQLMAAIGAPGQSPEGRFFPDTYAYSRGVSDITVLKRAHQSMQRRLAGAWAERDA